MAQTKKKSCVVKRTIRVVCPDDCDKPSAPCKKKRTRNKPSKKRVRKPIRRVCPPPQIHVDTPAPIVNITPPPPTINVESNAPAVHVTTPAPAVNVTTPAPIVHVKVEDNDKDNPKDYCRREMRAQLSDHIGDEIEVITAGGAGGGGEPPNRLGVLESVGRGTFALRSERGGTTDGTPLVYYSICQIIGFVVR